MTPAKLILLAAAAGGAAAGTVGGTGSGTDADPCHTTNCDKSYTPDLGACMVSHAFTCNVAAADCAGSHLAPGYVYSGNGCCLCEAGCDHSKETGTSCTYYDTRTIPETCKYTATIDPFAGPTGYFKFAECGDVANPVIAMKQGETYIFDQADGSNWYHPLGMAYFPDGAHTGVDELEPGIAQTGGSTTCAAGNTCQAPMYYKNGEFAGTTYDNMAATPVGGDDFGLDVYEPDFFYPKDQWGENSYFIALTITDTTYAKDLFYFCHIHAGMSGTIRVVDSSVAAVSTAHATSVFDPATYYMTPSTYDQSCGTYGLDGGSTSYKSGATCTDEEFLCHTGTLAEGSFGDCLKAMDCQMDTEMMTTLDTASDVASFMHQMIPHHENAINMAKLLLKQNALTITRRKLREEGRRLDDDGGCADCAIEDMLWSIIVVQGHQVITMKDWLAANSKPESATCTHSHRMLSTPNLRVAPAVEAPRRLTGHAGTGAGTEADPCVTTNCNTAGTECTFTATVDPHAGPSGYYKFNECGDVAMPVISMKRGVKYIFDQSDASNWYHPLGMAYFPDGAHAGVDELEPGITQTTGDTCAAGNTCQAPRYFKDNVFAGTTYDNTAATPVGGDDFGLDNYEPEFFIPKGDWLATKYKVELTITDTAYATDMFYFCHIHAGMSGIIKIADATTGAVVSTKTAATTLPADYYKTPTTYDKSCGSYGIDAFQTSKGACGNEHFVCTTAATPSGSFGDCLSSMDCAMDYNMKTTLDSNDVVSFMWQMIPHHENAVNMAKLLMKQNALTLSRRKLRGEGRRLDDDGGCADCAIDDMLWDIVSVQSHQILTMKDWLTANGKAESGTCSAALGAADAAGHVAPTMLAAGLAAAALLAA